MGFLGFLGAFVQYTALDAVVPCNSVSGFLRFLDHIYIYTYICTLQRVSVIILRNTLS